MGRTKAIIFWGLGLLILSAAGITVFLAVAGDDFYRWVARQLLEDRFERQVHFNGTFAVDVGLEPTLAVTEVWIEDAPWSEGKEMARVGRFEIQIALRPLLRGVVHVRRLVVRDLTLDLKKGPDGRGNWETADGEPGTTAEEDLSIPVLERVSLNNVAVTYRGGQDAPDIEVLLDELERERMAEETNYNVEGEGTLNGKPFRVSGRFGSVEDALAAAAPFPLEVTLDIAGLETELQGTAEDFPRAKGFDMNFSARAPSIGRVLETWDRDLAMEGRVTLTAGLRGDLASLSVEDLAIEIIEESGQELRAAGSMSDLLKREGLDLRFTGAFDPEALGLWDDPPDELREVLSGAERLHVTGRVTGDLGAPVLEDLHARLAHGSGANLSLRGGLALAFPQEGARVTALEASANLSLPDAALLQQALRTPFPDMGAIQGTAEFGWENDWIKLRALEIKAASFGAIQLTAEGRLAKLAASDLDFAFDPLIDITASMDRSRPLIAFLAEESPEAEATSASRREVPYSPPPYPKPSAAASSLPMEAAPAISGTDLILAIQQRLRSAGVDPGPLDGIMGPRTRAAIETYQAKHGFAVDGRATMDLLQHLRREAELIGTDLILAIQQRLRSAGVDPGPLDGIMGPRTRAAIETYQAKQGLAVDGRATMDLLQHLRRDAEPIRRQAESATADAPSRDANWMNSLPELGPVTASAKLSQSENAYHLGDLRLALGAKGALWVKATGDLKTPRPERQNAPETFAVTIEFDLPSSTLFREILPPELPELRNVRGRFDVRGSPEAFSVTGARIEMDGPQGLTGNANGQISSLSLSPNLTMRDIAFDIEARSPTTESVARLVDLDLPELGPVRSRGTLRDRGDLFALTPVDVWVGPRDRPVIRASGLIGDLVAMKRIQLSGDLRIPAVTLLGPEVPVNGTALGSVQGRFVVSDADGLIGLKSLRAELKNTELLSLQVEGQFNDINRYEGLLFETSLRVPNVSELGRKLGLDVYRIGELSFNGRVSGGKQRFQAKGRLQLGETDLSGELTGSLAGERPTMRARLHSPVLHLADLGLLPDPGTELKNHNKKPAEKWLFGEEPIAFEALKEFDLDLDVQLDQVKGIRLEIDKAEARARITDGLLRVDPLRLDAVGGRIEMRLLADARPKVPAVNLDIVANDVDVGDFLSQVEAAVPLDGKLIMVLRLGSAGRSPRSLAESVEGEFNLAIAQGQVRTSLLDATVISPLGWALSRSARRGYSDLNCLVARFEVQDGLAKSIKLLLDTRNVLAVGEGVIDFRNETMNIGVRPRSKRRRVIRLATPFRIQGPLASPSVRVSTTGVVTRMVGNTLASPINTLGSLYPLASRGGRNADNPCLYLPSSGP